jgi:protein-ribulosamine 3-kinase
MAGQHSLLESIRSGLSEKIGEIADLHWVRNLPGGDINHAALIRSGDIKWFVKYHSNPPNGMFAAEAQALAEIAAQECIRVPSPVALGSDGSTSWLVLEYLELSPSGPAALLGEQLAAMHSISKRRFGWSCDNYIGTTRQINKDSDNWVEFWGDSRLRPQLAFAKTAGFSSRLLLKGERLLENLKKLMDGHQPAASLLHGDLWAGNKAFTVEGQPVIFDPASYYGDRETDIAMTELFGGFEADFYAAYQACSPLPDGYRLRRDLYNLYHMLNHLNLFGGAYLSRCENMIDRLMAEIS